MQRPISRPQSLADLPELFSLPFVAPEHFSATTESLQKNLDLKNYLKSTIRFFSSFGNLSSGINGVEQNLIFPSSVKHFRNQKELKASRRESLLFEQGRIDSTSEKVPRSVVFAIPAVIGEDALLTAKNTVLTLRNIHRGAELNLGLRRAVTTEFPQDPAYDYKDYKAPLISDEAVKALDKIRVWNTPRDEEQIYLAGELLKEKATKVQPHRKPMKERIILIEGPNKYGSFIPQQDFASFDRRMTTIQASQFGSHTKDKIREPLVGEIEPHLIEKVIAKNRFELQLCFENALRRNKEMAGNMEWQWRIDSRGIIDDLSLVKSTISDQTMINCVRSRIQSWKFPRPRHGAVEISYPFEFKPARG
jgi:hypothetical protein